MTTIAIYAGTYDPFTKGHLSVLRGGLKAFNRVLVGVGNNTTKRPMFSAQERMAIIQEYLDADPLLKGVNIEIFDGLLIDFCRKVRKRSEADSVSIIRGLRAVSDFEAEMAIADANRRLDPYFPTLFLPTEAENAFVSSSIVKEIARHGGPLDPYVIPSVAERLRHKLRV